MSLKNISLDPFFVAQLYNAPIVPSKPEENKATQQLALSYLGKHRKKITIFIQNDTNPWLPDDLYQLLTKILQACRLSMEDIALINTATYPEKKLHDFTEELSPQTIIFLGGHFKEWIAEHPEKNVVQREESYHWLFSDDLTKIRSDKQAKKDFWQGLRSLFNLK